MRWAILGAQDMPPEVKNLIIKINQLKSCDELKSLTNFRRLFYLLLRANLAVCVITEMV